MKEVIWYSPMHDQIFKGLNVGTDRRRSWLLFFAEDRYYYNPYGEKDMLNHGFIQLEDLWSEV